MVANTRPQTISEADIRSRLRDVERRICDTTGVTIGAMPFAKVGHIRDLRSLFLEREELQRQMSLVTAE